MTPAYRWQIAEIGFRVDENAGLGDPSDWTIAQLLSVLATSDAQPYVSYIIGDPNRKADA